MSSTDILRRYRVDFLLLETEKREGRDQIKREERELGTLTDRPDLASKIFITLESQPPTFQNVPLAFYWT